MSHACNGNSTIVNCARVPIFIGLGISIIFYFYSVGSAASAESEAEATTMMTLVRKTRAL